MKKLVLEKLSIKRVGLSFLYSKIELNFKIFFKK